MHFLCQLILRQFSMDSPPIIISIKVKKLFKLTSVSIVIPSFVIVINPRLRIYIINNYNNLLTQKNVTLDF